jgi:hypothetical protein
MSKKVVLEIFVKFMIFTYLKFNKFYLKTYICTVIKIANYSSQFYIKCYNELLSFKFKFCIV